MFLHKESIAFIIGLLSWWYDNLPRRNDPHCRLGYVSKIDKYVDFYSDLRHLKTNFKVKLIFCKSKEGEENLKNRSNIFRKLKILMKSLQADYTRKFEVRSIISNLKQR